jgi:hypothetical protein
VLLETENTGLGPWRSTKVALFTARVELKITAGDAALLFGRDIDDPGQDKDDKDRETR